jgi:hypothetical protein
MQIKLITFILFFVGFFHVLFFQILQECSPVNTRNIIERNFESICGTPETYIYYCFLSLLIGYLFPLILIKILNIRRLSFISFVVSFSFYFICIYGLGGFCAIIFHLIADDLSTLNFRACFLFSFLHIFCGGNGLRLLKYYGCLERLNSENNSIILKKTNRKRIRLYSVPVASTSFLKEACLYERDEIRFTYELNDKIFVGRLVFHKVSAQRTQNERCCTVWHINKVYDTLVEIENSDWSAEIKKNTTPHLRNDQNYHHYMIYLDSVGCFEFIADSWAVFEEEQNET